MPNPPEPVRTPLRYPVTVEGETYDALTMRRAKARDSLAAEKGGGIDAEKEIRQFSNLCEVPPEVIEELDLHDYKQLQDVYRSFLS